MPGVNLGFASFLDGVPPLTIGFHLSHYIQYWIRRNLLTKKGGKLLPLFANESVDTWISLSQFFYQSDLETLFGGKWSLESPVGSNYGRKWLCFYASN